jgi:hypothetical protein
MTVSLWIRETVGGKLSYRRPVHNGQEIQLCTRYFWRSIMGKKRRKMGGTVEKIIKPVAPGEPEKAQISVEEADPLYREIRVENVVADEKGGKASLKPGADVDVIIEANSDATIRKPENPR